MDPLFRTIVIRVDHQQNRPEVFLDSRELDRLPQGVLLEEVGTMTADRPPDVDREGLGMVAETAQ
jgi:hypothetical protein